MGDAHKLHDQPFHYAQLAGILAGEGGVDLRITRDLTVLDSAQLEQFDIVVNWTTFVRVTSTQIQGLLESVRGGTGSVALHSGNTTFWNSPEYLRMLGSRWIDHDEIKRFSVHIEQPSNPVVAGVTDFEIEDELLEIGGDTSKFTEFTDAFCERAGRQTSSGSAPGRCSPT